MRRKQIAAIAFCLLALCEQRASANGRYPAANLIVLPPHDPSLVLVRLTFGALVSRDQGATFDWICEDALRLGKGVSEDPMFAIGPRGLWVATTYQGLVRSSDMGCSWTKLGGELSDRVFVDVASSAQQPDRMLAMASTRVTSQRVPQFSTTLFETRDGGGSFRALGEPLDASLFPFTLDLAPTNAARVYVSAVREPDARPPSGALVVSSDPVAGWTEEPVALEPDETGVFIAAVDPTDQERVYLRTQSRTGPSRLLVRERKGVISTIFSSAGRLDGFALSTDGSKLFLGGIRDGLWIASAKDVVFRKQSDVPVECLAYGDGMLWACSSDAAGFTVGNSHDDGATFERRFRLCDVSGPPVRCGADTPAVAACGAGWAAQQAELGCAATDVPTASPPSMARYQPSGGCAVTQNPHPLSWVWGAVGAGLLAWASALFRLRSRPAREFLARATRSCSRPHRRPPDGHS